MNLSCLLSLLKNLPAYRELAGWLCTAKGEHQIVVLDAAKPCLIAALYEELGLPFIVVTAQPEVARKFHEQLRSWCSPDAELYRLPERDLLAHDSSQLLGMSYQMVERMRALAALALYDSSRKPPLIVASALAVASKVQPRRDFVAACHVLQTGMTAEPLELMRRWQSLGYEVEDAVEMPGQMSRRGGIVDIFPPCSQLPVRIEFFGNQMESIRYFDPESQRSTSSVSLLTITPAGEFVAPTGSVFDYLGDDGVLVFDDPTEIGLAVDRINEEVRELKVVTAERDEFADDSPLPYFTWEELELQMKQRRHLVLGKGVSRDPSGKVNGWVLPFLAAQSYSNQLEKFLKTARQMIEQKQRVVVVSHQANRLCELFQKEDIHTSPLSELQQIPPPGSITVLQGSLDGGWQLDESLTLITDLELFGFIKQPRAVRKRHIPQRWFLAQLSPGDYVVHVDHGIAIFRGLLKMSSDGVEREYLVLEYAGGDRLYVPTERIHRVSRYIGAGDQTPHLSRLRTSDWQRTKRKVKESVKEIARELLELYAIREVTPGFSFSPDTLWQQELEASFPYVETPDQLEAIMAVKEDMEKPKPMDRLICGDVGYGKTEIALRAAFKAVMDNKQVAILVPTTVLAQQHFITFAERLQTFPLRVEMLSRFCPPEKEREILQGLANGTVDICIGTHRLLQRDVVFKDLGLVIIDEEQQFGVVQKERLKQIRKEVDTLALSATPIPRTLHMSLTGIRDMSIVGTPPEERLAVKTYVGTYDPALVRQVILRELERNGQVFFVHNRVQTIALAARRLEELVPEARIAIAHGQMPEEQLEKVMTDFISGKYDILVTTTIIQLGLDMPNVNTLIVDQADKFGLAQLYQLRGRVGRGVNQAYAYFFFDEERRLTPQAYKRLKTILEASELGSGFAIAMKDLEIRGAGNLLGVRQSGHISAVGFELYCQLLAEAVEELKARQSGETRQPVTARGDKESPTISLPLDAHIPEEYVPNLNTRLSLYHRLARVERVEEVQEIAWELEDRFGPLPEPVQNLLYMVKIKVLAMRAQVESIYTQGRQIIIKLQMRDSPLRASGASGAMMEKVSMLNAQAVSNSLYPPYSKGEVDKKRALVSGKEAGLRKDSPLKVRGERGVMTTCFGEAVKITATQVRLDTKLLGDRWQSVLEQLITDSAAHNNSSFVP